VLEVHARVRILIRRETHHAQEIGEDGLLMGPEDIFKLKPTLDDRSR
jgi:hypothetical protein